MILTLDVLTPPGGTPPSEARRVFRAVGGSIGRAPGNDWVLPDSYVSSRHARIIFANGVFQIEDTSTNGVSINSPDHRLVRGQPQVLRNGDRILIDPYEIRVSIAGESTRDAPSPLIIGDPFGPARFAAAAVRAGPHRGPFRIRSAGPTSIRSACSILAGPRRTGAGAGRAARRRSRARLVAVRTLQAALGLSRRRLRQTRPRRP